MKEIPQIKQYQIKNIVNHINHLRLQHVQAIKFWVKPDFVNHFDFEKWFDCYNIYIVDSNQPDARKKDGTYGLYLLNSSFEANAYLIIFFVKSAQVFKYFRYLGISALGTTLLQDDTCTEVPGLVIQQVEVCKNNPESLLCISEGARRGILECQYQFRNERWNCTTSSNYTVFGDVLRKGIVYVFYFNFQNFKLYEPIANTGIIRVTILILQTLVISSY